MIYVTADLHGDYTKYTVLLEKINLSSKDALVILGDVIDRGSQGIKILMDIMGRDNVFMLLGNHEQIALACLEVLGQEITEESIANLEAATTDMLVEWLYNLGGQATLDGFSKLSQPDKEAVLAYLEELPLYEEFEINGQTYLLVHGGLENFAPDKEMDDYTADELIWHRIDYGRRYFDDKMIMTGHTPTRNIDGHHVDRIYQNNGHIAMDCGAGFGGVLGCICLNTGEEFYV
ncbi:metallophosphoesterase [Bengtsoniella intestinalis]|uniref:metallophosphoesterase n=1 Tax=Bengtsoniella intestinalis TaxID=3073143 RepID=UPI00391F4AE7